MNVMFNDGHYFLLNNLNQAYNGVKLENIFVHLKQVILKQKAKAYWATTDIHSMSCKQLAVHSVNHTSPILHPFVKSHIYPKLTGRSLSESSAKGR